MPQQSPIRFQDDTRLWTMSRPTTIVNVTSTTWLLEIANTSQGGGSDPPPADPIDDHEIPEDVNVRDYDNNMDEELAPAEL